MPADAVSYGHGGVPDIPVSSPSLLGDSATRNPSEAGKHARWVGQAVATGKLMRGLKW